MRGLLDRYVDRAMRDEEVLVNEPSRARTVLVWGVLGFAAVLAATTVRLWAGPGPLNALGAVVLGAYAGLGAIGRYRRAASFRNGWLAGRARMLASIDEALRRGLTMDDWVRGEVERDAHLFTVHPLSDDEGEGGSQ